MMATLFVKERFSFRIHDKDVGFEVLTAVNMNPAVFCGVTLLNVLLFRLLLTWLSTLKTETVHFFET
jgi:hypothetical protein